MDAPSLDDELTAASDFSDFLSSDASEQHHCPCGKSFPNAAALSAHSKQHDSQQMYRGRPRGRPRKMVNGVPVARPKSKPELPSDLEPSEDLTFFINNSYIGGPTDPVRG